MILNKAVFLDRDGTINTSVPYIDDYSKFEFYPKTIKALKLLILNGYKIVIITNQSGIGRGFFSLEKLNRIHKKMLSDLQNNDIILSGIYYCPHVPEDNCKCRKPETEMLKSACTDLFIDPHKSYFIGDKMIDVITGKRFGCKSILVKTGCGESEFKLLERSEFIPDKVCTDLLDATNWLIEYN